MKKYLPFFIGYSVLFNFLLTFSFLLNGYFLLRYHNPFGPSIDDIEVQVVKKTLMESSKLLNSCVEENTNALYPVLEKKQPFLKETYIEFEERMVSQFSALIEKLRMQRKGFDQDEWNKLRFESEIFKRTCKMEMNLYFQLLQNELKFSDAEVEDVTHKFSKDVDRTFMKMAVLNNSYRFTDEKHHVLQIENDVNQLTQLKYIMSRNMQRCLMGGRICGGSYFYPMVVPRKYSVKVGEPVEINLGVISSEGSINNHNIKVKVNGDFVDHKLPFLLTESAKKGRHAEKINIEIRNPITGQILKREFNWEYLAK